VKIYRSSDYVGNKAWDAIDIERVDGATVRLHWTDKPYVWHENDGPEVFAVLDGTVDMHTRGPDGEKCHRLKTGDIFHAAAGDQHKAEPVGEARVLVIERAGSI
jgi:mannose-6-phosphate isomerase-like protein (cupin superfamily)